MLPVAVHVPLAGSYSSALLKADCYHCSPCHQHLAVGQQRRRVTRACGAKAAGGTPRPVAGSYSFRAAQERAGGIHPPATSTLPLGSNVAVWLERAAIRLPVAVQAPVAGSYSSALLRARH